MFLLMLAIVAVITLVIMLAVGGIGAVIMFGDIIVFIVALYFLAKWLFGKKRKKE